MAQLLSNLPIGAKIKFGSHQINTETTMPIVWIVVDKNHAGYPANSVTLITEKIIDLRAYDAKEPTWTDTEETKQGYINYKVSNINQWLNSEGAANEWYTNQHESDRAPLSSLVLYGTEYQTRPGFLYNFTATEKQALLPTTLVNQHGGGVSTTLVAKIFLPSTMETMGVEPYKADGSTKLSYFNTYAASAFPTQQVITNTLADSDRKPTSTSAYWS